VPDDLDRYLAGRTQPNPESPALVGAAGKDQEISTSRLSTGQLIASGRLEIGDGYRAKNVELAATGIPFARAQNLNSGFDFTGADRFPLGALARVGSKASRFGDCVLTSKGSVGRVGYVDRNTPPFVYSPQLSYWRSLDFDVIDPEYLRYWLQGPEFVTQRDAVKGATDMADYVNLRDQRRMTITLPAINVQRKITAILSPYDDLIENNNRRIKILEEMAQRIYREWFVDFRYPGHEGAPRVDSELGPIPQGWHWEPLRALAQQRRLGVNPSSIDPETPYIGLEHMPERSIAICDWGRAAEVSSLKYLYEEGDILFGKIRPYFHKVGAPPVSGICSTDAVVIRSRYPDLAGTVLAVVSSDAFVQEAVQTSQGTKMPRANWNVLENYPIAFGSAELMERFNATMISSTKLIQSWIMLSRTLRTARDLLLPRLISGEIDVENLDIAVEEAA
jgi:type I restriction enzyme, S subunit